MHNSADKYIETRGHTAIELYRKANLWIWSESLAWESGLSLMLNDSQMTVKWQWNDSNASQTCILDIGTLGTPTATQAREALAAEICLHAEFWCSSFLPLAVSCLHRYSYRLFHRQFYKSRSLLVWPPATPVFCPLKLRTAHGRGLALVWQSHGSFMAVLWQFYGSVDTQPPEPVSTALDSAENRSTAVTAQPSQIKTERETDPSPALLLLLQLFLQLQSPSVSLHNPTPTTSTLP